jgi:DNA polymerase delta subunit 1
LNAQEELKRSARDSGVSSAPVTKLEVVQKTNLYGYQFGKKDYFLKIFCAVPNVINALRRVLEDGISIPVFGPSRLSFNSFESNISFDMRFMIDCQITGGGWIEIPRDAYYLRINNKSSSCQIEVDVHYESIVAHKSEGEWIRMAPIRILSFDIECASREDRFPDPLYDPIIQISNVVKLQNEPDPFIKNVFTLKSCAPIAGAQILSFEDEAELLKAWRDFVDQVDPDVFVGYNIINFDFPYIINRSRALKVDNHVHQLGRKLNELIKMKDSRFSSRAYGTHESKDITIEGRVQFDLLPVIQREFKLRSYSLNSVSAHFLNQQKEDVHYSIITDLQNGTAETRRRLAVYCLKDSVLCIRLLDKLMFIINFIEMARVTGVTVSYLLFRGQQIKVLSQLYRHANPRGFLIPSMKSQGTDETYEGATVFEPVRGYYSSPITTLDFSSLYPSIMMAHNLCYTTLLSKADLSKVDSEHCTKTPTGDHFVKSSLSEGILPMILKDLLAARKKAKQDMKKETDPLRLAVLNGRQLALKISANSVYGFTGATVGQLPCLAISSSVTSFGRDMIEHSKTVIEREYCIEKGFPSDAKVIYGDTDSVMINFGIDNLEKTFELGKEAAALVTKEFLPPIKLEFEKVYYPYLLMNKKRYAGLYWTEPTKWSKMDAKGIEVVLTFAFF